MTYQNIYLQMASLFLVLCGIICIVIGYKNRKRFLQLKWFYVYPLFSVVATTLAYCTAVNYSLYKFHLLAVCWSVNIFILIEFLVIYNFFLKVIQSKWTKTLLYALGSVYVVLTAYSWLVKPGISHFPKHLFIFQSTFILAPTLYYFIELLLSERPLDPNKNPNFWICIGLMFYFGCTLPTFLLADLFIGDTGVVVSYIYLINYFCYCILFLLITRAFLCPEEFSNNLPNDGLSIS